MTRDFKKNKNFFLITLTLFLIFNISNNYYKNFQYETPKEFLQNQKEINY